MLRSALLLGRIALLFTSRRALPARRLTALGARGAFPRTARRPNVPPGWGGGGVVVPRRGRGGRASHDVRIAGRGCGIDTRADTATPTNFCRHIPNYRHGIPGRNVFAFQRSKISVGCRGGTGEIPSRLSRGGSAILLNSGRNAARRFFHTYAIHDSISFLPTPPRRAYGFPGLRLRKPGVEPTPTDVALTSGYEPAWSPDGTRSRRQPPGGPSHPVRFFDDLQVIVAQRPMRVLQGSCPTMSPSPRRRNSEPVLSPLCLARTILIRAAA